MKPLTEKRYLKASELRAVEREGQLPMLVGKAVVYNSLSEDLGYFREMIKPGAFTESLKVADVRALIDHDPSLLIGRNTSGTLRLFDTPEYLGVEIDLPDTSYARDLVVKIKPRGGKPIGDLSGMSFSFVVDPEGATWYTDEEGKTFRTIVKASIEDVSAVTYPAYIETEIAERSLRSWKEANPAQKHDYSLDIARLRLQINARS
jgi:HK97 family phage prohead protease